MIFEWKKWSKNPKNILLVGLAILSVFVSLANLHNKNQGTDQAVFEHLKAINDEITPPQDYTGPSENYKLLLLLDENGELSSNKEQALQKILLAIVSLLEDEQIAQLEKKWTEKTTIQTERLELQQKYLDLGGEPWRNEPTIAEQLARNRWLLGQNIPIANLEMGQQGFYFVYYLLNHWMNFLIVIMIALFFFDFLTSEYERKNYLFMAVQPVSRKQFFRRKYVVALSIFVSAWMLLLFLGFVTASVIHGTGSLMYPVTLHQGATFKLIPLGDFLLKTISLQLLFSAFAIRFLLLLSKWLKNTLKVVSLFLVIMFVPSLFEKLLPKIQVISGYLPFSYMNTTHTLIESSGSFLIQVLILIGWNLVLALIWRLNWRAK